MPSDSSRLWMATHGGGISDGSASFRRTSPAVDQVGDGFHRSPMPPSRIRLYAANVQVTQPRTVASVTSGSLHRPPTVLIQPIALLDTFANLQAHRVALATGGAMVDGAAPTFGVAGNVGLDPALLQRHEEVLRVVAFVCTQRCAGRHADGGQQIQRVLTTPAADSIAQARPRQRLIETLRLTLPKHCGIVSSSWRRP